MPRRAAALAALLLLAGCSSSQTQPPPDASQTTTADACQTLIDAMPDTLDGDALSGQTSTTATWGTEMVLTCGVDKPEAYKRTSEVYVVNDISWFGEKQSNGYTFTAIGRKPLVAVFVPESNSPEVNPLVDLAPVMAANTRVTGPAGETPS